MHGSDPFYDATKQMHNALQGDERGASRRGQWEGVGSSTTS